MTALALCSVVLLCGLAAFTLACRLSPGDCWDTRTTRRVAAWRRVSPWLAALCSVGAGLWLVL